MSPICGDCGHPKDQHLRGVLLGLLCTEDGCECEGYLQPDAESWRVDSATDSFFGTLLEGEQTLVNVHSAHLCMGRHCCLHDPSDHPLRDAPRRWRSDLGIMERLCSHKIAHPDPDDLAYRNSVRRPDEPEDEGVHGCDGCCVKRG